jgi:hypothetical protein
MLDQFVDTCLVLALCSFHVILYHINSDQLGSTQINEAASPLRSSFPRGDTFSFRVDSIRQVPLRVMMQTIEESHLSFSSC